MHFRHVNHNVPNRKGENALTKKNITQMELLRKKLEETDTDVLKEMLGYLIEQLMNADVDAICGAEYGERYPSRMNSRNGYRPNRALHTRAGTLGLDIPKLRKGSYYPDWLLESRKRSERAMVQVISEAWVSGVSTRKMDRLVKTLGIDGISKSTVSEMAKSLDEKVQAFRTRSLQNGSYRFLWLDATMVKCREFGSVENVASVLPGATWNAAIPISAGMCCPSCLGRLRGRLLPCSGVLLQRPIVKLPGISTTRLLTDSALNIHSSLICLITPVKSWPILSTLLYSGERSESKCLRR